MSQKVDATDDGFELARLVLIVGERRDEKRFATGYLLRPWLLLTAHHLVREFSAEKLECRHEVGRTWHELEPQPLWSSEIADAAFFRLKEPIREIFNWLPEFKKTPISVTSSWESYGYPKASTIENEGEPLEFKTSGLSGKVYAYGGGGQGNRELELTVEAEPKDKLGWTGISGTPIFIDGLLAGIIKTSPEPFALRRLKATPMADILRDPLAWEIISRPSPDTIILSVRIGCSSNPKEMRTKACDHQENEFSDFPDTPKMVAVPAGEFMMGASRSKRVIEPGNKMSPAHPVKIANAFCVSKYQITFDEFSRFVESTKYIEDKKAWTYEHDNWEVRTPRNFRNPGFRQGGNHPVVCVNWHDAEQYCDWLTTVTGWKYRLPSEAEWEYAARAGSQTTYAGGDSIDGEAHYRAGQSSPDGTVSTRKFGPNRWGLFGFHGNVWEWVTDCWHDNYQNAPNDAVPWLAAAGGDCAKRVVRGGSWNTKPPLLSSASRHWMYANTRMSDVGFRIVREIDL